MRFRAWSVLLMSWSCAAVATQVRNVIVCIGDGMGEGQVEAARCYVGTNLFFESFPFRSRMTTLDAGGTITDSAAAATAVATGRKVYNGVVSLALPGDASELETLLEAAKNLNKRTGLVTTSYLTDATPAAFGAHESNRYNATRIALDYLNQTRPEVLFGGGAAGLDAMTVSAAGYTVVSNRESLLSMRPSRLPYVCGLFGWGYLPYEKDGLGMMPSLSEMTAVALQVLQRDTDGFFLMIEGGLIDIACHGNDLQRCIGEVVAFDAAVKVIGAWCAGRDDTLVLVTADHETGGLSVLQDNGVGVVPDVRWTSGGHTDHPVPLYGWGVNADQVSHVRDNTQVFGVVSSQVSEAGEGLGIVRVAPEHIETLWATTNGGFYRVEFSETLNPPMWQSCGVVEASGPYETFVHTNPTSRTQGFYRMIPTDVSLWGEGTNER